jgi:uncharacterized membrane protein
VKVIVKNFFEEKYKMATLLSLGEIQPTGQISQTTTPEQFERAKSVKKLGIIALVLTAFGAFIPLLGILMLIAALLISRYALRVSRQNLVPIEYEKPAYWASIISSIILILSAIGLFWLLMNS